MKKTIPAKVEVFCDICNENVRGFNREGFLKLSSNDFDGFGHKFDTSLEYDLCDSCLAKFERTIDSTRTASKNESVDNKRLWNDLNNLLTFLTDKVKPVDELVDDFYLKKFNNPAPGELLRIYTKEIQDRLNSYRNTGE